MVLRKEKELSSYNNDKGPFHNFKDPIENNSTLNQYIVSYIIKNVSKLNNKGYAYMLEEDTIIRAFEEMVEIKEKNTPNISELINKCDAILNAVEKALKNKLWDINRVFEGMEYLRGHFTFKEMIDIVVKRIEIYSKRKTTIPYSFYSVFIDEFGNLGKNKMSKLMENMHKAILKEGIAGIEYSDEIRAYLKGIKGMIE